MFLEINDLNVSFGPYPVAIDKPMLVQPLQHAVRIVDRAVRKSEAVDYFLRSIFESSFTISKTPEGLEQSHHERIGRFRTELFIREYRGFDLTFSCHFS